MDSNDPADDPPIVFLNFMYWRSREDFYRKRGHLKPWETPELNDYEASARRRHWLVPVG